MRDGYRILDADCHQWEPPDFWAEHIDPAFRDRVPRQESVGDEVMWVVEGETLTNTDLGKPRGGNAARPPRWAQRSWDTRMKESKAAGFPAHLRLRDMDRSGVDVQVVYPTVGGQLVGREFRDPELLAACCRAYNDWSRLYCQAAPTRLRWAALLPLQDVSMAVDELERAAALGAAGGYLRPNPVCGRNLHHQDYDPLWATFERVGLPVSIHNSEAPRLPTFGDRMDSHTTAHVISHPFEAMATMVDLIFFGVFERFPGLRVVHVECGAGWLPFLLQRMEEHMEYTGGPVDCPGLTRSPTEYFERNMLVAAAGAERTIPAIVELVGDRNLVFNTDYPHPDGSWPEGVAAALGQPVPDEAKRKLLWDNAAALFGVSELATLPQGR